MPGAGGEPCGAVAEVKSTAKCVIGTPPRLNSLKKGERQEEEQEELLVLFYMAGLPRAKPPSGCHHDGIRREEGGPSRHISLMRAQELTEAVLEELGAGEDKKHKRGDRTRR